MWNGKGKQQAFGYYKNPEDAHRSWQEKKIQLIECLKVEYKEHEKLVTGLQRKIDAIRSDIEMKRLTIF